MCGFAYFSTGPIYTFPLSPHKARLVVLHVKTRARSQENFAFLAVPGSKQVGYKGRLLRDPNPKRVDWIHWELGK